MNHLFGDASDESAQKHFVDRTGSHGFHKCPGDSAFGERLVHKVIFAVEFNVEFVARNQEERSVTVHLCFVELLVTKLGKHSIKLGLTLVFDACVLSERCFAIMTRRHKKESDGVAIGDCLHAFENTKRAFFAVGVAQVDLHSGGTITQHHRRVMADVDALRHDPVAVGSIGENDRIDDLKIVLAPELGKNVAHGHNRLRQRRAGSVVARHNATSVTVAHREQQSCHVVECLFAHAALEPVEQSQLLDVNLLGTKFSTARVAIRKCVDAERNVDGSAEHRKHDRLLDGAVKHRVHATAPVDHHHHAVILALFHDCIAKKDIIAELVTIQLRHIQLARLGGGGACVSVCRLSQLKLLGHHANLRRNSGDKVVVFFFERAGVAVIESDLLGRDDDFVEIDALGKIVVVSGVADAVTQIVNRTLNRTACDRIVRLDGAVGLRGDLFALLARFAVLRLTLLAVLLFALIALRGVRVALALLLLVLVHLAGIRATVVVTSERIVVLLRLGNFLGLASGLLILIALALLSDFVDALGKIHNLVKGFGGHHLVKQNLVLDIELNQDVGVNAALRLDVEAINQRCAVGVDALGAKPEHIFFPDALVSLAKVVGESPVSTLHQLLDACVLDNVEVRSGNSNIVGVDGLGSVGESVSVGAEQRMTHFVGDEHIIKALVHVLPTRKHQTACLYIKVGGLCVRHMLNNDVLLCHQTGECALGVESATTYARRILAHAELYASQHRIPHCFRIL